MMEPTYFDTERWLEDSILVLPVRGGARIRQGAVVMVNAGYAEEASPGDGKIALGVAEEPVDNTTGSNGAVTIRVRRGVFLLQNDPNDPVGQSEIGKDVYASGPNTVRKTNTTGGTNPTLFSKAGRLLGIAPNGLWVEIR